jgi:hypothetical protein
MAPARSYPSGPGRLDGAYLGQGPISSAGQGNVVTPMPSFMTAFGVSRKPQSFRKAAEFQEGRYKVTERALGGFGPAERETVIRALAAIRRNLAED